MFCCTVIYNLSSGVADSNCTATCPAKSATEFKPCYTWRSFSWKGIPMTSLPIDRLAILTVSGSQSEALMKDLSRHKFQFTIVNSTAGVMQEAQVSLLVGFAHRRLDLLLEVVRANCETYRRYIPAQGFPKGALDNLAMVEAQLGGALVCVMNVDHFEQI